MWPVHHIQTEAWHAVSSFGTQISSMQGVSEQRGERFFLFMYNGCTLSHLKKRRVWVCVVTSVYVKVFVACSSLEPRQSSINRTGHCSFRNESSFLFDARQSDGLVCSKKSSWRRAQGEAFSAMNTPLSVKLARQARPTARHKDNWRETLQNEAQKIREHRQLSLLVRKDFLWIFHAAASWLYVSLAGPQVRWRSNATRTKTLMLHFLVCLFFFFILHQGQTRSSHRRVHAVLRWLLCSYLRLGHWRSSQRQYHDQGNWTGTVMVWSPLKAQPGVTNIKLQSWSRGNSLKMDFQKNY